MPVTATGGTVSVTGRTLVHPSISDPSLLDRIAERLNDTLGAEHVIVYGSVARGEATVDSDVDLFVIAPSSEDRFPRMDRVRTAIRDLDAHRLVSPLVATPDEVRARLEADDRFLRQIIETGVELGRPNRPDARDTWGRIRPMPGARPSDSWRQQARRDWRRMNVLLAETDGDGGGMFLQQALEKLLKGWLLEQGWELQKTHALDRLLVDAQAYEPTLLVFGPLAERVSRYYAAGRYPDAPSTGPTVEQVRLDAGEALLLARALFPDEDLAPRP